MLAPRPQSPADQPPVPARTTEVGRFEEGRVVRVESAVVPEVPIALPLPASVIDEPAAGSPETGEGRSSTPWGRTADLGVAIGERSKAAGTGTASAFRRFAARVANSF
jgi:hypothetical protein